MGKYKEKRGDYPPLIIIDVPRDSKKISYRGIEQIKNACFYSSKYECEMVVGNCPTVVIFSNFKPDEEKMSKDRWDIKCIGDGDEDCESESDYGV